MEKEAEDSDKEMQRLLKEIEDEEVSCKVVFDLPLALGVQRTVKPTPGKGPYVANVALEGLIRSKIAWANDSFIIIILFNLL